MAVSIREGVELAFAPGSGSNPANETLDPGLGGPSTGDILALLFGTSNAGGFPNPTPTNDSFGGTWENAHNVSWGSRRTLRVDINDDWTTPTGTVEADYNATAAGRALLIVEGASDHFLPATTGNDNAGGSTSWSPDLSSGGQAGHDYYLLIMQMENDEAISTSSTGWSELGTQIGESSGVRRIAMFVGDASVGGFDTTPTFSWTNGASFSGMVFGFTAAAAGGTVYEETVTTTATVSTDLTSDQLKHAWGVPQNFTAMEADPTTISLLWDAVAGATGYDIERNGVIIASNWASTSYDDQDLPEDTYDYRVRAVQA